jgi:hypothetical protein
MFMLPREESEKSRSPKIYKSAAIDAEYVDLTPEQQQELISTEYDKYQRLTKLWILGQEIAGQITVMSVASFLFVLFRSANWFGWVIFLFGFSILAVVVVYTASWKHMKPIERVRYFFYSASIGCAAVISGSDIIGDWVYAHQALVKGVLIGTAIILTATGCKLLWNWASRKGRRY